MIMLVVVIDSKEHCQPLASIFSDFSETVPFQLPMVLVVTSHGLVRKVVKLALMFEALSRVAWMSLEILGASHACRTA